VSYGLFEQLTRRDNRLVRRNEMLLGAILNLALACRGKGVVSLKAGTHTGVGLGRHGFPFLHETVGFAPDQSVVGRQLRALAADNLHLKRRSGAKNKCILPMMGDV